MIVWRMGNQNETNFNKCCDSSNSTFNLICTSEFPMHIVQRQVIRIKCDHPCTFFIIHNFSRFKRCWCISIQWCYDVFTSAFRCEKEASDSWCSVSFMETINILIPWMLSLTNKNYVIIYTVKWKSFIYRNWINICSFLNGECIFILLIQGLDPWRLVVFEIINTDPILIYW